MDTQLIHLYQRNSNDQRRVGQQRPHDSSNGTNGNNPQNKGSSALKVVLVIVATLALLGAEYLFLTCQNSKAIYEREEQA